MRWPSIACTAAAPDPARDCWCICSSCSFRLQVHLGGPQAGTSAAGDQQAIGTRCRREQSANGRFEPVVSGRSRPKAVIRVVNNCGCMARCVLLPQRLLVDINDGLTSYFSLFKHFVGSLSLVKGETKLIYQRLQLTRFCQLGRLAQDFAMVSTLFAGQHWQ